MNTLNDEVLVTLVYAEVPLTIMELSDILCVSNDEIVVALQYLRKMNLCAFFQGEWYIIDEEKAVQLVEKIVCEKES